MEWLNYHHLLYFWKVAREGSILMASEKLRVSQPSICAQLKSLEEALGEKLFRRSGRNLVMTETGQLVFGYAEEIFSLGSELLNAVKQGTAQRALKLNVGVADSVPKQVASAILKPVFNLPIPVHVVCREGKVEDLLSQLAAVRLDIVLSDEPASTGLPFKTFNHLLGSCGVTFCAMPELAKRLQKGFPKSLNGAPALLPTQNTSLRRSLEKWFQSLDIRPRIVAEFEDGSLMKSVARGGGGFIPVASVVADEAVERYKFRVIGATEKCTDQFYAITAERRLTHPAVILMTEQAQKSLFR
ncbi:MAG: LysR family transcriptional regulator [Verrucomicrobiales bacterium]|nr:LysR family transcriptional regulator [Verrucomicrobiales bacterium]